MEDSPILLLFMLIYLIAAASGSKKKGNKKKKALPHARERRGPMRTHAQGEQLDWRSILQTQQTRQGFSEAFDRPEEREAQGHEPQSGACVNQPIHLHEASQAQMACAAEGEDPCHAGGRREPEADFDEWQDDAQNPLMQDVLRGVIMSEVLTRPQERAAKGKRRYHG